MEQTQCTSETITNWALASNLQRDVSHMSMTRYIMSRLPPTGPQWLTYVGVCGHIVWCNSKSVGDREILETYSNSASKIHQKKTFFLMGQNLCWPVLLVQYNPNSKSSLFLKNNSSHKNDTTQNTDLIKSNKIYFQHYTAWYIFNNTQSKYSIHHHTWVLGYLL